MAVEHKGLPARLSLCRECGYEIVEMNASDTRNKSDTKVRRLLSVGGCWSALALCWAIGVCALGQGARKHGLQ